MAEKTANTNKFQPPQYYKNCKRAAVLVDGSFFLKRHKVLYGANKTPREIVDKLQWIAHRHTKTISLGKITPTILW